MAKASSIATEKVESLLPAIRARRDEIERERRMPRELIEELRKIGVFGLTVPRLFGGGEATPLDVMRTIETVARADGSAGWCTMIGTGNNVAAGYMPESGAREIFTSAPFGPSAGLAAPGGTAVRVPGGIRVKGRWSFASGITHSEWVWAGAMILENGSPRMTPHGPEVVHAFMPVRDVVIHDTWYVSGLCGTGSHDFSAADVFVPEQRIFALLDPTDHRKEPLYQMPPLGLFVYQLASVGLGIARGALDEFSEIAAGKTPTLYDEVLADKAVPQIRLAQAEAALGSARAFLFDTVEDIWNTVVSGVPPTPRQIALGRIASTHAVETAAAVTRTANTLAGGSSIYSASALQRHARDADAVTHHFTVAPHSWEDAGRVLLGRAPKAPVF